jgi:hypothetical protein
MLGIVNWFLFILFEFNVYQLINWPLIKLKYLSLININICRGGTYFHGFIPWENYLYDINIDLNIKFIIFWVH